MIIAVKRAVKGVHEKVINYLKHKNSITMAIQYDWMGRDGGYCPLLYSSFN